MKPINNDSHESTHPPLSVQSVKRSSAMKRAWMPLAASLLTAPAWSADWPQFRGPHRNGISQETGLLRDWPKQGPKLLWQLDIGLGYGAPAIVGGRIFLMSNRGIE